MKIKVNKVWEVIVTVHTLYWISELISHVMG
jgi:hypothetical protein